MPVKPTVIVFFFNLQWVLVVSGKIKFHDGRDENDWLRTTGRFRIVLVVKSIWSAWIDYEPRRKPNGNLIHRDRGEWTTVRAVRRLATWNSRWKVEKNDNTHEVFFFFRRLSCAPTEKTSFILRVFQIYFWPSPSKRHRAIIINGVAHATARSNLSLNTKTLRYNTIRPNRFIIPINFHRDSNKIFNNASYNTRKRISRRIIVPLNRWKYCRFIFFHKKLIYLARFIILSAFRYHVDPATTTATMKTLT